MTAVRLLILNGPNLNLLGQRQTDIYGTQTLADIEAACTEYAQSRGCAVECRQSNHEGQLIDWIHEARAAFDGVIINAGGFTHTSIALRDALLALEKPVIEVHLSNIYRREEFRHHSYLSAAVVGVICGLGLRGYLAAIDALADTLKKEAS